MAGPEIKIREAVAADALALARLHVKTYNQTHRGLFGRPTLLVRQVQWRTAFSRQDGSWFCFVAEDQDGNLVGFAKGVVPVGETGEFKGELNKIYVLRKYQRRGVGRQLIFAVARRFVDMGVNSMRLFGWAGNPNNRFYEVMGGERTYAENGDFHGGYGWRDLAALTE